MAVLELSRPFDLKYLREGNWALQYYIETLATLIEKIGANNNSVGVVLNSSMVMLKKVPIAMGLEEDLIQDQISWEAEQMLVSPLEQYNLVFERLPFSAPTGNPIYLQVLVRKKVIECVQKMLSESGLHLVDMDVDCFSTIRTLSHAYDLDSKTISVVIDLHRDYIGLVFIRKKEYFLSYKIFLENNPEDTSELVKMILKDLRRIIFGHGLGKGIDDINRFFLLDHISRKDFLKTFSNSVRGAVDSIHPFQKLSVRPEVTQTAEYSIFPERLTTAVGMLLKKCPSLAE